MQKIIISLNDNVLKVSTVEKGSFKGTSLELNKEVAINSTIVNTQEFAETLNDLIKSITSQSFKNLSLNIIVEPQDIFLKFIQVNKNDGEVEDQIVNDISTKSKEIPLNEVYFSYHKIAPFVYQFVAIKKDIMEKYLEVSNLLRVSLESVVPWPILLPKYLGINDSAIFISKNNNKQVVFLSEFNGIFYLGTYEKEKDTNELQKLVKDLSIYKRKTPINKVYLFKHPGFSLNPGYEVVDINIPGSENDQAKDYELHLLYNFLLEDKNSTQLRIVNLLNLLPLPIVSETRRPVMVYVGAGVAVLIIFAGIFGLGSYFMKRSKNPQIIQNTSQLQVLSDSATPQTTPSDQNNNQPQEELKREDLKIRIENGAGIQGLAGRTQDYLEGLGYKVDSIGDATETGRESTLLNFKPSTVKYETLLKSDMEKSFNIVVEENLDSSVDYDVLIIVGTDAKI